jgi:queuine tRNA-ribosyltransferase
MALDECPPGQSDWNYARKSLTLTEHWLDRCIKRFNDTEPLYGHSQSLFPIVQGCTFKDLRQESAKFVADKGADGNAIGGLAVGEGQKTMFEVLDYAPTYLPEDKPRYLMGVGRPSDIVGAVARGVDMFDCVMPSRSGRTGQVFTSQGVLNIRNACHQDSHEPLDLECTCDACTKYTRGYLHHLFRSEEILGSMLLTEHNIHFYENLMRQIRLAIEQNTFDDFYNAFQEKYKNDRKF